MDDDNDDDRAQPGVRDGWLVEQLACLAASGVFWALAFQNGCA